MAEIFQSGPKSWNDQCTNTGINIVKLLAWLKKHSQRQFMKCACEFSSELIANNHFFMLEVFSTQHAVQSAKQYVWLGACLRKCMHVVCMCVF